MASIQAGQWRDSATFADLPPDPSHNARMAQIEEMARNHDGRYEGCHG